MINNVLQFNLNPESYQAAFIRFLHKKKYSAILHLIHILIKRSTNSDYAQYQGCIPPQLWEYQEYMITFFRNIKNCLMRDIKIYIPLYQKHSITIKNQDDTQN